MVNSGSASSWSLACEKLNWKVPVFKMAKVLIRVGKFVELEIALFNELAESPWHQDGVRRQGQARQGGPGGAAACEWGAEAAMCREAKWWGVKETRVALRVQVFLLTVPDLIPKLTPSPSRDPSPGASGQTLCLPA